MKMLISDLPQETIEKLCSALERGATVDWKALMRKWFSTRPGTRYSEDDVAMIESSKEFNPARALLDDLTRREISLDELLKGLRFIGNQKAVSIIKKGRMKGLFVHI